MQLNYEQCRKIRSYVFWFVVCTFAILMAGMWVNSIFIDTELSKIGSSATIFISNILVGIGGLILAVKIKMV